MTEPMHPFDVEDLLAHRRWLRAIARSLVGDEHAVDDLEQQVWLAAMERPPRKVRSITGWLRSVLRSKAVDTHRVESRREAREQKVARPEPVPGTAHLVAQAEAQRVVATAVTELDEPYRSTVLLRYFEGLPPREVAVRLGVPVETVRTRLKRAHDQLRGKLDGAFGDDRRAWVLALLPLVRPPAPAPAGPATAAATAGAALVSAKTKLTITALIAAALLGSLSLMTLDPSTDAPGSEESSELPISTPSAASATSAEGAGTLHGLVRRKHDGMPAANVDVTASRGRGKPVHVTTDDDGVFELTDLPAGITWSLTAAARGFTTTGPTAIGVAADVEADAGTLWLESSTQLVVRVVDHREQPVPGAEVELFERTPTGAMAETNSYLRSITTPRLGLRSEGVELTGAGGEAVFDGRMAGGREIAVTHADLVQSGTVWTRIHAGDLRSVVVVRMLPAFALSGRFVDADGRPVSGFQVWGGGGPPMASDHGWSVTDEEGRFRLGHLRPGRMTVHAGTQRVWNRRFATVDIPFEGELLLEYPRTGSVVGQVTDEKGEPVRGAVVALEAGNSFRPGSVGASGTTDSDGRYRIDGLPEGSFGSIHVWHPGFRIVEPHREKGNWVRGTGDAKVTLEPLIFAGRATELDLVVGRGARIHGHVLGPDGPVSGAWVGRHATKTPNGEDWETVVTDAEGRYTFDAVPAVPHSNVITDAAGTFRYALRIASGEVKLTVEGASGSGEAAVRVEPGTPPLTVEIVLSRSHSLAGVVRLADGGEPVAGASILVRRRDETVFYRYGQRSNTGSGPELTRAVTDGDGRFELHGLSAGDLYVVVAAPGFAERVVAASAPSDESITIEVGRAQRLSGRLEHTPGVPAAAVSVILVPAEPEATAEHAADLTTSSPRFVGLFQRATDPDGRFDFRGLRPGTYTVEAHLPGPTRYEAQTTRFGPFEAGRTDLVLTLDRPQTARILGRVVDTSGRAIAKASIDYRVDGPAFSSQRIVEADDGGRFEIPETAHGRYRLTISGEAVVGGPYTHRLFRGVVPGDVEQTFVLEPGLSLRGRIVDGSGSPAAGIDLLAELPDLHGTGRAALSDADGHFEIRDLEPGEYELSLRPGGDVEKNVRLVDAAPRVQAGTEDLRLVVSADPRIRGVALDRDGAPLADFLVWAVSPKGGYELGCRTDERGGFEFPGLEPGVSYWLRPGYGYERSKASYLQRVAVEPGKLDARLTFDREPK